MAAYNREMESAINALTCGCQVTTSRDFLGRVVGTITQRGSDCARDDHQPGKTVLMPGRENARPE
jgi:hypothetical protein